MTIGILAAVLGLLIATAAIWIPRLVARRNDPYDKTDSLAYMKETGRSAQDIARDNSGQAFRQDNDSRSQRVGRSDSPPPHSDAGSRETS
jgi:hypothetical protein